MNATLPLPARELVAHALRLIGRSHKSGAPVARAARDELALWRATSPQHEAAAAAAQRLWDSTDGSTLRDSVPRPAAQVPSRRRALGLLGLGGLVAGSVFGGRWYWQQPVHEARLATGHAQLLARTMPDGTRLDLAPRSSAEITYYRDRRELRLRDGELRLQVKPDADRPFTVSTALGRVRVLGTTFSVSVREGRLRVAVAEGRVAVWSAQDTGIEPGAVLGAGDTLQAAADGAVTRSAVQAADVGAWRDGWLVFDDTPLPEALARWNDWLRHPLQLGRSAALAELRLSGSFPLRDPQAFLDGLPDMLPVRVLRRAPGEVLIESR